MTDTDERPDRDSDEDASDEAQSDTESFIPSSDAGATDAAKYSRDEKDHGRQDYGP